MERQKERPKYELRNAWTKARMDTRSATVLQTDQREGKVTVDTSLGSGSYMVFSCGPGRCGSWSSPRSTRLPNNHEAMFFMPDLPAVRFLSVRRGEGWEPSGLAVPMLQKEFLDHLLRPSFWASRSGGSNKLLLGRFCLNGSFLRRLHLFMHPRSWGPPGKT